MQLHRSPNFKSDSMTARVCIGDLAQYSAGTSSGRWIDLDDCTDAADLVNEATSVLADGNEEWHICDHEGFEPFGIGRYENLDSVFEKYLFLLDGNTDVLTAACYVMGERYVIEGLRSDPNWVEERFAGISESPGDFAYSLEEDSEWFNAMPESIRYYLDWEQIERDYGPNGDFLVAKLGGTTYFFRNC